MTETYKSMENPLERLVNESGKNAADVLCPKENCECVILRKNAAVLVERDGSKVKIDNEQLQGILSQKIFNVACLARV